MAGVDLVDNLPGLLFGSSFHTPDEQLTFPLLEEVPIWAYNWDLMEALHKSPKAEKEQEQVGRVRAGLLHQYLKYMLSI